MTLSVLNPVAQRAISASPVAPRLPGLRGRTLGLWWNRKFGGDTGLERIAEALVRRDGVTLHRESHPYPGPKTAIAAMAEAAGAVVGATGD